MKIAAFVFYFILMLGIGIYFFVKSRRGDEKDYFLGGRQMGPWVTALSAGASDMSAWVLMGLPTSIYALGLGQVLTEDKYDRYGYTMRSRIFS